MPSASTLDRDINCLLRSYAVKVPREQSDPEDALECPLSELGVLIHSKQSGFFHLNRDLKPIPFELFGYAVTHVIERSDTLKEGSNNDLSLTELVNGANMPGRVFALTSEATYELVASYEAGQLLQLDGQAGERIVRIMGKPSLNWLTQYYDEHGVAQEEEAA